MGKALCGAKRALEVVASLPVAAAALVALPAAPPPVLLPFAWRVLSIPFAQCAVRSHLLHVPFFPTSGGEE